MMWLGRLAASQNMSSLGGAIRKWWFDGAADGDAGEDDGNGRERSGVVNESDRGKF